MTMAIEGAIIELRELLGDRLSTSAAVRGHHAGDESWHEKHAPEAVCLAGSAQEVSRIVGICARHQVPIIPWGTGTGLEGGTVASSGGICVDVSGMTAIIEVNEADLDCVVQPGVTRKQLNHHLRGTGLFFPIDPGADASLGGMAATRASGTNAVRYGTMRENVLSLKVVTADGRIVSTGGRARKSAAGYDLTRLFVGSEGTLGIIVEVALRLHGLPEAISAARVYFDAVEGAVTAAMQIIQCGIPIARMELLDAEQMRAINRYSKTAYPEQVALFLEFHGSHASVKEQAETVGGICADLGGSGFEWTAYEEERSAMWAARHDAAYAAMAVRPGRAGLCHRRLRADLAAGRLHQRDPGGRTRSHRDADLSCWAMSATAISITFSWSTRTIRPNTRRYSTSAGGWWSAPSPWAAPAPANTASVWASGSTWRRSSAKPAWR
jgi:D-lactate dehydrogenase (cytochrome)